MLQPLSRGSASHQALGHPPPRLPHPPPPGGRHSSPIHSLPPSLYPPECCIPPIDPISMLQHGQGNQTPAPPLPATQAHTIHAQTQQTVTKEKKPCNSPKGPHSPPPCYPHSDTHLSAAFLLVSPYRAANNTAAPPAWHRTRQPPPLPPHTHQQMQQSSAAAPPPPQQIWTPSLHPPECCIPAGDPISMLQQGQGITPNTPPLPATQAHHTRTDTTNENKFPVHFCQGANSPPPPYPQFLHTPECCISAGDSIAVLQIILLQHRQGIRPRLMACQCSLPLRQGLS